METTATAESWNVPGDIEYRYVTVRDRRVTVVIEEVFRRRVPIEMPLSVETRAGRAQRLFLNRKRRDFQKRYRQQEAFRRWAYGPEAMTTRNRMPRPLPPMFGFSVMVQGGDPTYDHEKTFRTLYM